MVKPTRKHPVKRNRTAQRSMRIFYLALLVIAVVGIGALTYVSNRPKAEITLSPIDTTLPKVESNGYAMGSPSAPVEVIEFGDFECPACGQFATITEPDVRSRLVDQGKIRFRFIDFPLSMHQNTWNASRAAACADEQGKFWPMHDAIFATQDRWNTEATRNPDKFLKHLADSLGLNTLQFDACVDSKKYQAKIQAHERMAIARNVQATPTFVFGDEALSGPLPYDEFKQQVDALLARSGSPLASGGADSSAGKRAPRR